MLRLLAFNLVTLVSLASGAAGETTKIDYEFQIVCDWVKTVRTETTNASEGKEVVVLATSPTPELLVAESARATFEIPGIAGVRQFVLPALPGHLAGGMITVFPDGRGVRTQTYDFEGEFKVTTEIGNCEVVE